MTTFKKNTLYFAWFAALISTLGSLYFSEIAHFPPCSLCWYQRIFMYPLVIILAVGIILKDKRVFFYALPLSAAGSLVALYQNLLYTGVIPESAAPCSAGISCTQKFIEWFGFITIPFLSLASFILITCCLLIYKRYNNQK